MWQRVYVPEPQWKLPEYTWDKERELCKQCKHYRERVAGSSRIGIHVVMTCALNPRHTSGRHHGTCLDERYDGACGREGKLFERKG